MDFQWISLGTLSHGKDNGQWSGRVQGDSPGRQKSAIWSVFLYYCIAVGGNCIVLYVEVEVAGDLQFHAQEYHNIEAM